MKATKKSRPPATDLPETKDDKKHLAPDEGILDLPDVKDIPGQEHVRPMPPGEMTDITISSADEEADDLLDTDEDTIMHNNANSNVTKEERELLQQSSESMSTTDDQKLRRVKLDQTDEDGIPLNETSRQSGNDLDIPGSELDDENEETGGEDEENNFYSLGNEDADENSDK